MEVKLLEKWTMNSVKGVCGQNHREKIDNVFEIREKQIYKKN